MNPRTIDRTNVNAATVSTVQTAGGSRPRFETAIIVDGRVTDPRITTSLASARIEHDRAVDFLRGDAETRGTARAAFWAAQVA